MHLQNLALVLAALSELTWAVPGGCQFGSDNDDWKNDGGRCKTYKHVAFFSVDGLHSSDLPKWVSQNKTSTLASLLSTGYWYQGALTSAPSDSYPGDTNLVSGATPAISGIWYDDAWDRQLWAPKSNCKGPSGAEIIYDETVDYNNALLWSSPNPTVPGGNIDPANLPMALISGKCTPLYPHMRLRTNTIFEIAHAHGQTAYTDKHPSYDLVRGPSGKGLSVAYFPEIQSLDTTNVEEIIGYDQYHVDAFLAWIGGSSPPNTEVQEALTGTPMLFGGNFQAVSVAQKSYGYVAGSLAFTPELTKALTFVDSSLGAVVSALKAKSLLNDTLIVVCSKHGQAPIDPTLFRKIDQHLIAPATNVNVSLVTADDVGLIWLANSADTDTAVKGLQANATLLGIEEIIYGDSLRAAGFGDPLTSSAVPDIIVRPQLGVVYTTSTAKIAEHGGLSNDDRNVACLVSNPALVQTTFSGEVSTAQVAPSILKALGLNSNELDAVKAGVTHVLPGFGPEHGY